MILKEVIKKIFAPIHRFLENSFYLLLVVIFTFGKGLVAMFALIYPVFNIWRDVAENQFTTRQGIIDIFIGLCLFYTALALEKIYKYIPNGEN